MTSYDVTRALLRRWWFLLVGLALTGLVASQLVRTPATYWTTYDLNLVAPDRSGEVYSRTNAPSGVIPVAGVLEVLLAGNHDEPRAATQQVPIFGLEHEPGVDVRAKDKGLQWSRDYVAALTVQISQPTREAVLARSTELARRAHRVLEEVQDAHDVARRQRLTLEEPATIDVLEIAPSHVRALLGTLVLGFGLTLVLGVLLDRWLVRRSSRPRGPAAEPRTV